MEAEVHIDFAHSHFRAASAIKWTQNWYVSFTVIYLVAS